MTKVTAEAVRERLAKGGGHLTILDARGAEAWDKGATMAAGAIRVPPDQAEKHIAGLDRDDYIVIYCT